MRDLGVKFGRYHIFLFKLFKPSSVSLRILLWKNFNEKNNNLHFKYIPKRKTINKDINKKINDNPFNVLSQLNLK